MTLAIAFFFFLAVAFLYSLLLGRMLVVTLHSLLLSYPQECRISIILSALTHHFLPGNLLELCVFLLQCEKLISQLSTI